MYIAKMPELKLHVKNSKHKIIGITEVKPKHFRYNLQNCELVATLATISLEE
jgi:hypothetical protein